MTFDTALASALQELGYILPKDEVDRISFVSRHVAVKMLGEARDAAGNVDVNNDSEMAAIGTAMFKIDRLISQVKGV